MASSEGFVGDNDGHYYPDGIASTREATCRWWLEWRATCDNLCHTTEARMERLRGGDGYPINGLRPVSGEK